MNKNDMILWGCISNIEYKLDKPILDKKLGFYFISKNEKLIQSLYNHINTVIEAIPKISTIKLYLEKNFEGKEKNIGVIVNRMVAVLLFNQHTFKPNINFDLFISSNKTGKKTYTFYISLDKIFPTPNSILYEVSEFCNEKNKRKTESNKNESI